SELSGNELRKAKKRKSIIEGAIKAFEQEGYERSSMDLVAKLAGASKRTVYNHFESKKDLLWAVIAELMAGQSERVQIPYENEKSMESQLGRFFDAQVYFVMDSSRLAIVRLLTSIFVQNQELRDEASKGEHCQIDQLKTWLNAAKKDKRLKFNDPELAAQVFRGLVEGMVNFPAVCGPLKTAKEVKSIKDEVIAVFLARYGA
ncbi:TetR/AcrR family transcriptional regulator, partial [Puniceicoccaceae bacterium K14]|nr:TetR/AcrR family transcriptional regulator [Puniceicoccaceae bacterium K14]